MLSFWHHWNQGEFHCCLVKPRETATSSSQGNTPLLVSSMVFAGHSQLSGWGWHTTEELPSPASLVLSKAGGGCAGRETSPAASSPTPVLLSDCHLGTTSARGSDFLYLITFDRSVLQDCFLLLLEPGSGLASSQYFDIKWGHWSSKYRACFRYCFIVARDVISPNMTFSEYHCLFCMCRICSPISPPSESKSLS